MQIRHAKADDECEEEHHGGEDAGDPGEREQNLPDANVDGVGAYVDEHEFLQALVEAGAEDEGGRDQRDEQADAEHRSTARAAASFGESPG